MRHGVVRHLALHGGQQRIESAPLTAIRVDRSQHRISVHAARSEGPRGFRLHGRSAQVCSAAFQVKAGKCDTGSVLRPRRFRRLTQEALAGQRIFVEFGDARMCEQAFHRIDSGDLRRGLLRLGRISADDSGRQQVVLQLVAQAL